MVYSFLRKLLFTLDPEVAHHFAKMVGDYFPAKIFQIKKGFGDKAITSQLGETIFQSPIGLAAGFDKNGEMIPLMSSLGFGFLEIGSITSEPCEGNPKPRIFRLPKDKSMINRMGLPNWGSEKIYNQLKSIKTQIPLGINIAKTPAHFQTHKINGIDDMLQTFSKFKNKGAYTVFNLSCPNTEDGKTFEDPAIFTTFAKEICQFRKKMKVEHPVLVKLSPQIKVYDISKIVETALKYEFDGFVLSNTSLERNSLKTKSKTVNKIGKGGLSGQALLRLSNLQLQRVRHITGSKAILMGVGGLMTFENLVEKLSIGASYFQVYTGLIYGGPTFVGELNRKLIRLCHKLGVSNYKELIGQKNLLQEL